MGTSPGAGARKPLTTRKLLLCGALLTVLPAASLLTAAGAGAGAGAGTRAGARAESNSDPGHLQVYDANVENLPTPSENDPNPQCAGDWHDLLRYMQKRPLKPDVYVVQQLNGRDHLELLLARMKEYFGEEYEGVLAENDPESQPAGDCKKYKHRQTNAVIWRDARFEQLLPDPALPGEWVSKRWQAQKEYTVQGPPPAKVCENNTQTRTRGVKVKLHDEISGKDVTAASLHWPTGASDGPPCGVSNAGELSKELTEDGYGGADLYIAGGDTNTADLTQKGEWTDWYRDVNGAIEGSRHHFRDAVHTKCGGSVDCLRENWTLWNPEPDPGEHRRRIDFLLGRKEGTAMPEMSDVVVPPLCADEPVCEGELRYSDHRAVGARIHY